jgi:hypothetical protein
MFTQMSFIKKITHTARDTNYELNVYQVQETGEYSIYISKDGFGVGNIFVVSQEVAQDAVHTNNTDVVAILIENAISDIDRNAFNFY